jgi:putative restriction endonuclease
VFFQRIHLLVWLKQFSLPRQKLHSPNDYIVGGGFFSHSAIFPVSLAWQAFDQKNGATTEQEMRARVERYRRSRRI